MMKIKTVFVVRLLFVSIFLCNSAQGMKRLPEVVNLDILASAAVEVGQREGIDWGQGLAAETKKKVKFESTLTPMQPPKKIPFLAMVPQKPILKEAKGDKRRNKQERKKEFKCKDCTFETAYFSSFKRHIKNQHK